MPSIASIRDSRVEAHEKPLEAMDLGMLFAALVETSAMVTRRCVLDAVRARVTATVAADTLVSMAFR